MDVWFPGAELLYKKVNMIALGNHWQIDPTQHFNFICFHFLNHFVKGGVSLQMCIDLEMFYRKHCA